MSDPQPRPVEGFVGGRRVPVGSAEADTAVADLTAAFAVTRRLSTFERAAILDATAAALATDVNALASS